MFKVNIRIMENFNDEERVKLLDGAHLMERVINSKEFKWRVINFSFTKTSYTGFWPFRKYSNLLVKNFHWNKGFSNEMIYRIIMTGREFLLPEENGSADIEVTLYSSKKSVVGYTYPTTTMQWINKKFFSKFMPYDVAGNLSHEWLHKLGFEHTTYDNPLRKYTVPYAIGNIVAELAKKYYENPSLWEYVNAPEEESHLIDAIAYSLGGLEASGVVIDEYNY